MIQFSNLSSWRQDSFTIPANEHYEVTFLDTKPNMFIIQNPNNATLKISISGIPTATNYEFKIGANATAPIGRPTGTGKLNILNSSNTAITGKVFSLAGEFDINILNNSTVDIASVTLQGDMNVQSFQCALPSGSNTIGNVGLVGGSATIGNVGLNAGSNNIGKVTPEGTNIESMITKLDDLLTYWRNFTALGTVATKRNLTNISNDLTESLSDVLHAVQGVPVKRDGEIYINGDSSISYTATEPVTIVFKFLINESDVNNATVKINNVAKMTIEEGEQWFDLDFFLTTGDVLTVTSTDSVFRARYDIYKGNLY